MKIKKVLLIGCLAFVFLGCNSKEIDEVKNQNILLVEENQSLKMKIEDLQKTVASLEEEKKKLSFQQSELEEQIKNFKKLAERTVSSNNSFNDTSKYEVHNLMFTLDFKYGGFNTKVYSSTETEEVLYTIQTGDKVQVTLFVHDKEADKDFIEVTVDNIQQGYIKIRGNPYENGNFEFAEKLEVEGSEVTILKMEKYFSLSDGITMKKLPSDNSENIHEITHKEGGEVSKSSFITSDYKWAKVKVGDYSGWVPANTLHVERGGPTLETPEEYIYFDLIGGNLI